MKDALDQLGKEIGVKGSLVLTKDGMVVASCLTKHQDENVLSAISSNAIRAVNDALGRLRSGAFQSLIASAEFGKLSMVDCGDVYLVVVLEKQIQADLTMLAIHSTARKIRNLGSFTS